MARVGHALASSSDADPGREHRVRSPAGLWTSEVVDAAGAETHEGRFVSVVDVSRLGLVTIAYYESDDYYSTGRLKVAYQLYRVFMPLVMRNH